MTKLRCGQRVITVWELEDEKSYLSFRDEAFSLFFSKPCECGHLNQRDVSVCVECDAVLLNKIRGIVFAKEIVDRLCIEKAKPVTAKEFSDYANMIEAACNAIPRLIDELRDEYAHDENGNKVEGVDGEWVAATPLDVFPITAKKEAAWGRANRAEGFALPEVLPAKFAHNFQNRLKLIDGQRQSLAATITRLKEGRIEAPELLGLIEAGLEPPQT